MTKRELSAILAAATAKEVAEIAAPIKESCDIKILKEPQKTLVMVKVRESVQQSLFYLGEVLASECMVTVNGIKGASVMAGDDFNKCLHAAVIDGFLNGEAAPSAVTDAVAALQQRQQEAREDLNRRLRQSKVQFNVMGDQ